MLPVWQPSELLRPLARVTNSAIGELVLVAGEQPLPLEKLAMDHRLLGRGTQGTSIRPARRSAARRS
jgi:hypothetical protein